MLLERRKKRLIIHWLGEILAIARQMPDLRVLGVADVIIIRHGINKFGGLCFMLALGANHQRVVIHP